MDNVAENVGIVIGLGSLITVGLLFWTRSVLRRFRRVVNLPTSVCRGIAPGLTELKGEVRYHGETLRSPLAGRRCIAFEYSVTERQKKTRTVTDKDGKTRTETYHEWVTLFSGDDRASFDLVDETGAVPGRPEKARPANLVAGITGFPDMPPIHARDFERKPVEVRFDAPGLSR